MATTPLRFRIFVEPQEGASYDDQRALAQLAEELGFDAFFRSDHYISFFGGDGLPGPTDAWTTIAGLARETSRIRLGTLVSPVTFRAPGPLAISVAQIDAMSNGRVELGADRLPLRFDRRDPREVVGIEERLVRDQRILGDDAVDDTEQAVSLTGADRDDLVPCGVPDMRPLARHCRAA